MVLYNEVIYGLPFLGNIQFYTHLLQQDVLIDIHEHYVKQSLRNRCELIGSQGPFHLSIPIHRPSGKKTPLKDIRISYAEDWQHDHLQAIRSAYGSSPYFIHYWDDIVGLYASQPELLMEFSLAAHAMVGQWLGIPPELNLSEDYIASTPGLDMRGQMKTGSYPHSRYIQVFADRMDFIPDRSVLDLIFCEGPASKGYLLKQAV